MLPGGDWSVLEGSDPVLFYELGDTTFEEFFHGDESPTDAKCIGTFTEARGFIATAFKCKFGSYAVATNLVNL